MTTRSARARGRERRRRTILADVEVQREAFAKRKLMLHSVAPHLCTADRMESTHEMQALDEVHERERAVQASKRA